MVENYNFFLIKKFSITGMQAKIFLKTFLDIQDFYFSVHNLFIDWITNNSMLLDKQNEFYSLFWNYDSNFSKLLQIVLPTRIFKIFNESIFSIPK